MQPHEIAADPPTFEQTVLLIALLSGIVLGFINMFRLFATMITHKTLRKAIETNPQLTDEVVQRLTARRDRSGDDRLAIVLVAIGIAMVAGCLIAVDDPGMIRVTIGAAMFPLLVGGALWIRFRVVERARRRDRGE